jgi:hypothetical protein
LAKPCRTDVRGLVPTCLHDRADAENCVTGNNRQGQKFMRSHSILAVAALAALAACGETPLEQGALGAVGGAVAGRVLVDDALAGAAVGAAGNIAWCQRYPARC